MSYDICVFNKKKAPKHKADFIKWYEQITEWNSNSCFDDISVASKELQEWYSFMLKHFPAMNGRDAEESQQCYAKARALNADDIIDDCADYSIDNDLIYVSLGHSQAESAFKLAIGKANELDLGIFDPQDGNLLLCEKGEQAHVAVQHQCAESTSQAASKKKKTVDELIQEGDFKGARRLCYRRIVFSAAFVILWIVIFSLSMIEEFNSIYVINYIIAGTPFNIFLYFNLKDLRKVKASEESFNSMMRTREEARLREAPERLNAEIKRLLGSDCEVMPIEDDVCVNELTDIYFAEREHCKNSGMYPVILQLDSKLIENLEVNQKKEWDNTLDAETEMDKLKGILHSRFSNQSDWNEFVGNKDDEGRGCLDAIDDVDFMWGRFVIAKLPVTKPADIFVRIPIGDWGECPAPMVHHALTDYWNSKYDAVPCFISSEIIMYNVPKPVDEVLAYDLAVEHAAYCADEPFASGDTLWGMANQLKQSTFWHFTWSDN